MLFIVAITSAAPYLYMAEVLGPSAQEGLLVGTAILPLLTALPMLFVYGLWDCFNCGTCR
jgi:hypothetical protein